MKNNLISTRWFPKCDFSARRGVLSDNVFEDFDQQAEQLVDHDQTYLQLTRGMFQGRFLSAFLGDDVAIHMEYSNQALEQDVSGSPDHLSFGVVLSDQDHFLANGSPLTCDDVFVLPPSASLHLISPLNGAIMAIAVRRDVLLRQTGLSPVVGDWMANLAGRVGFLSAPRFAHRLREDVIAALEEVSQNSALEPEAMIGQALVASIASKLSLEWRGAKASYGAGGTVAFDRFQSCRNWLQSDPPLIDDTADIARQVHVSRRSIEQAFSQTVSMGPLTYMRLRRLHDVRRKLVDPSIADQSIGDIAASHGFWDWSRFSHQYRIHFGELPSTTRKSLTYKI